jgi:hypothetical protein
MGSGTQQHGPDPQACRAWVPETACERVALLEQLERILASPGFSASKKYPAFLRHIVEETLEGRADRLKERSLGVAVFGRPADYDTASDPIVRSAASEVRKRLCQYYHELAAPGELTIDLPAGSYVPRFRHAEKGGEFEESLEKSPAPPVLEVCQTITEAQPPPLPSPGLVERLRMIRVSRLQSAALAALVLIAIAAMLWKPFARTALDRFWGPVFDFPGVVLIAAPGGYAPWAPLAAQPGAPAAPAQQPDSGTAGVSIAEFQRGDRTQAGDATTLANIASVLGSHGKRHLIRFRSSTELSQLRTAPAVLIGALNNPWTMRLTANMRFTFHRDSDANTNWIQDRKNPEKRDWLVNYTAPYMSVFEDWAVVSRFQDMTTQHTVIVAAGLSRWGTVAAGEFLSDPEQMKELARLAPPGWERKNIQIVIATRVINGQTGPPRILATEFW